MKKNWCQRNDFRYFKHSTLQSLVLLKTKLLVLINRRKDNKYNIITPQELMIKMSNCFAKVVSMKINTLNLKKSQSVALQVLEKKMTP